MRMPIICWKNVPSELDTYVIDKDTSIQKYFISCAALFAFQFVLDKQNNLFVTQNNKLVTLFTIFKEKSVVNDFSEKKIVLIFMRNGSLKCRKAKCLDRRFSFFFFFLEKNTKIKIIQKVFIIFQYPYFIDIWTFRHGIP